MKTPGSNPPPPGNRPAPPPSPPRLGGPDEATLDRMARVWPQTFAGGMINAASINERKAFLRAALASMTPTPQAPQVPEGWALVPVVATEEMRDAGWGGSFRIGCAAWGQLADKHYAAVLAATPPAPEQPRCATCDGRGLIGGHVGQTPESFDLVTEPCPECNAPEQPKPEPYRWLVGNEAYLSEAEAVEAIMQWGPSNATATPVYRDPLCSHAEDEQPKPAGQQHPDDVAVDRFAAAMKEKLAIARAKGRGGWDDKEDLEVHLSNLLRHHVEKGDPVDVANFCMFLHQRGESIQPKPAGDVEAVAEAASRQAFERWAVQRQGLNIERWADSGNYKSLRTRDWWQCWEESRLAAQTAGDVEALIGALDHIGGLSRALRSGGPHPDDLHELSASLREAVDVAHDAIRQAAQPAQSEG